MNKRVIAIASIVGVLIASTQALAIPSVPVEVIDEDAQEEGQAQHFVTQKHIIPLPRSSNVNEPNLQSGTQVRQMA